MTGARTGHAGTLDPFATGLLLVLSGRTTKIAPCLVGLDKRYLTDVDLTLADLDRRSGGDGRRDGCAPPAEAELERRLAGLRGEIELPIPAASAVKIGGERAYRLARRGVEVEMPVRRSTVHALDVIAYTGDARDSRSACQQRHVRAVDRDGARRALRLAAADGGRAVLGRGCGRARRLRAAASCSPRRTCSTRRGVRA